MTDLSQEIALPTAQALDRTNVITTPTSQQKKVLFQRFIQQCRQMNQDRLVQFLELVQRLPYHKVKLDDNRDCDPRDLIIDRCVNAMMGVPDVAAMDVFNRTSRYLISKQDEVRNLYPFFILWIMIQCLGLSLLISAMLGVLSGHASIILGIIITVPFFPPMITALLSVPIILTTDGLHRSFTGRNFFNGYDKLKNEFSSEELTNLDQNIVIVANQIPVSVDLFVSQNSELGFFNKTPCRIIINNVIPALDNTNTESEPLNQLPSSTRVFET